MTHKDHTHAPRHETCAEPSRGDWTFWLFGLGSFLWLLLRSGTNPRRLAYPCQRTALAGSLGFVGYLASLLGSFHLFRQLKRVTTLTAIGLPVLVLLLAPLLVSSSVPAAPVHADPSGRAPSGRSLELPGWTSPTAVSNVFVVPNVPVPECSLDGGTLPATSPCNDPGYALRDAGVDSLVSEMEARGDYFYQTAAHPSGIVGADDVVVIKINNQKNLLDSYDGNSRRDSLLGAPTVCRPGHRRISVPQPGGSGTRYAGHGGPAPLPHR